MSCCGPFRTLAVAEMCVVVSGQGILLLDLPTPFLGTGGHGVGAAVVVAARGGVYSHHLLPHNLTNSL